MLRHPAAACLLTIQYYCTIILVQYESGSDERLASSREARGEHIGSLQMGVYTENVKEGFRWPGSLDG